MKDRLNGLKTLKVTNFLDEFEKDDIKKDIDIIELFNHFGVNLTKKGKNYTGLCPWHDDKNPSLSVDKDMGLYNCFGCGESGDIFTLTEKMRGIDFKESITYLKEFSGKNIIVNRNSSSLKLAASRPQNKQNSTVKPESKKNTSGKTNRRDAEPGEKVNGVKKGDAKVPDKQNTDNISLTTIANHYHKKLFENKKAIEYLKSRGLTKPEIYSRFKIGFADGSLLKMISEDQKKNLMETGIITEQEREHFGNCITVPIYDESGKTVSFYGRSILSPTPSGSGVSRKIEHLYLKGKHRGVFNHKASKVYDEIILTESIIDALSLIELGIENVQPIYGTNGFTDEHLKLLKDDRVKTVVIAFDNDESGRKAVDKLKEKLLPENFKVKIIYPESKDWNSELTKSTEKERLSSIIKDNIKESETFENTLEQGKLKVIKDGHNYIFQTSEITYRVTGVKEIFVSNLRVNVKAEFTEDDYTEKYYDNLDLFSARSRTSFSSNLSKTFDMESKRVEKDLILILEHLEKERDRNLSKGKDKGEEIILTEEERNLGMEFLTSPDLFDQVVDDMETLGYVGEDLNKLLMYIAATSRKLDDPISVIIISQSASGKSYLVDTTKMLIPKEDVISATSLSDQALNYTEDLEHKFLVLSEATHNNIVEHQLREMLSGKELSRSVVMKDPKTGSMKTEHIFTKTIVSTVMSSTNHNVNPENASRSFVIDTDESREQTRRIHESQRDKYTLGRYDTKTNVFPEIIKKHHSAQRLLINRVIVNNFGKHLDFPDTLMRTRRDHDRFMDLIACVCSIRQYQKERLLNDDTEYIECDLEDYEIAYNIMINGVLNSTMFDLPKGTIELYDIFREFADKLSQKKDLEPEEVSITQRELREHSGLGQSWVKQNLRLLAEYEYLILIGGRNRGSRGFYRLKENKAIEKLNLSMIPTVEEIRQKTEEK